MPLIEVMGSGPYTAKILLLGEAPARAEVSRGIPFCGPSGDILWSIMQEFGLTRDNVYTTNVVKVRCPGDNIKRLKELHLTVEEYIPMMWEEINAIKPNVIIALGNTALAATTRIIPFVGTGILKYRGSILSSDPYGYKVIPTIHPASLIHSGDGKKELYSWKQIQYIRFDINKAIEQSTSPEVLNRINRQFHIAKTAYDLIQFFRKFEGCGSPLSIDIETFKSLPITIAFAFTPYEAISFPLVNLTGPRGTIEIGLSERTECFRVIANILADENIKKIGHNFKFDQTILKRWGFIVRGFYADTILGAGVIYPELEKKLAVQSSIYTNEPFYKDEGREYNPKKDPPSRLLNYNAKDTVITSEVLAGQLNDMKELGIDNFYFNFITPLHDLYMDIESVGLKVDFEQRKKLATKYKDLIDTKKGELAILAGKPVNFNSPKQVQTYIFGDLGCPIRADTDDDTLNALKNNVLKKSGKWEKAVKSIEFITDLRKLYKTLNTYVLAEPDPDGRIRTSYSLTKETGRTSTNILKAPLRHRKFGISLHALTKHSEIGSDVRSMFIPDDDCVFLEADQSQAEARVVLLLAKEYNALEMFDLVDIHLLTASWIFKCEIKDLLELKKTDKDEYTLRRQLGKKVRHAGGYDMGAFRLAQLANISQKRAQIVLDVFHKYTPGIRDVFHKGIKEALANDDMCLMTPFGRFRKFYEKWGDKQWKEAFAHIPQSTIADNTKRCMLSIKKEYNTLPICIESHDGFTSIVKREEVADISKRIKYYMEEKIDFSKCSLPRDSISIPCEFKIGTKNLEEIEDYKLVA